MRSDGRKAGQRETNIAPQKTNRDTEGQSRGLGDVPSEGAGAGYVERAASPEIGERGDSPGESNTGRGTVPGKILSLMKEENEDHLAYHKAQVEKLTRRGQQLDQLFEELQAVDREIFEGDFIEEEEPE